MRAFVTTFDALVALSFLLVISILVSTQSFQLNYARGVYIYQLTHDVLSVMQKTGRLDDAIDGNSSAVRNILESTPEAVCMQILIYDNSGTSVASLSKFNCGETVSQLQIVSMPFTAHGNRYIAKAQSWYRKGYS